MNFDGSNIFKTLARPWKYVHGAQLALDPSFMTHSVMCCVTPVSKVGRPHPQDPVGKCSGFWWQLIILTAKDTGSGAQGVNSSSATGCATLGKEFHLSNVLFFQPLESGRWRYKPYKAVVWIKWVNVINAYLEWFLTHSIGFIHVRYFFFN